MMLTKVMVSMLVVVVVTTLMMGTSLYYTGIVVAVILYISHNDQRRCNERAHIRFSVWLE